MSTSEPTDGRGGSMATFSFLRGLPRVLIALSCFVVGVACAQSPAVNSQEADYARDQQQRQLTQPLNNAPLWKEVRSGLPQTTTVQGRETNVLIQSAGQTWRAARVPIAFG